MTGLFIILLFIVVVGYNTYRRARQKRVPAHSKCLRNHKQYTARRQFVPELRIPWSVRMPEYQPPYYDHESVAKQPVWADSANLGFSDLKDRITFSNDGTERPLRNGAWSNNGFWDFLFAKSQKPLNPRGRTGLAGRGLLGKWGPNHAADPIVTRYDLTTGKFQVVAIQRKDTGEWALPGGMVDPGESVSYAVHREFEEEAGALKGKERQEFLELTKELFSTGGKKVFVGYVDDPRNTDNAWMETTAFHFHCNDVLGAKLRLQAGDDAKNVKWMDVDTITSGNFYADHYKMIANAMKAWLKVHSLG